MKTVFDPNSMPDEESARHSISIYMSSSVIKSFFYNADRKQLRVVFHSGAVYEYLKVPVSVFDKMKKAASKGAYLNQFIKEHYACKKLK